MVLTEIQKEKNKQYSKVYYQNEDKKKLHADYMRSYHKNNTLLLNNYKKMLKDNTTPL